IEEMVKDNLEAFIFVQMLNDKKGNQEEVLDLKNMIVKEERQARILEEYGVLITSADSGLLEKNLSLMGDLLGHMPREFFGGQFLGLILSSSGMLLLSSLGMLSFLEGPSFSLAEFLKLFMKFLPEKPPLKYPRKNPVPGQDYTIYFWYICFLFMLWYLMGEPGLAWAGKIPGLLKQIRFPAKGGEKILPRILVSVRAKKSIARIHRRWKQKPARESYPRIGREKSLKNIAYFRELEQDVEKRLRRTKHWARYLESLKRGK
ncbi:MAG: hypothetical protein NC920_03700, partial [Candidatus Omnitrophica bacterium]|nr:hypothetical protein [Candidatus Omnitrophota bacterium]